MIYHDNSMLKSMSQYFCPIKHVVDFRDLEYLRPTERRYVLESIPLTPRPEIQVHTEIPSSTLEGTLRVTQVINTRLCFATTRCVWLFARWKCGKYQEENTGTIFASVPVGSPSPLRTIPMSNT